MKSMQLKRVAFSLFLLEVGAYIWLPTSDEIVIYPVLGLFLFYVMRMSMVYGVLLAVIIYRAPAPLVCFLRYWLEAGWRSNSLRNDLTKGARQRPWKLIEWLFLRGSRPVLEIFPSWNMAFIVLFDPV